MKRETEKEKEKEREFLRNKFTQLKEPASLKFVGQLSKLETQRKADDESIIFFLGP